jgi:hypothetical protein
VAGIGTRSDTEFAPLISIKFKIARDSPLANP